MDRLTRGITKNRKTVIVVFLILSIISVFLFMGVRVNYDLTDYLPEEEESTVALNIMAEEFSSAVPNVRAMAADLSIAEALEMKARIAALEGVSDVMWLDDVADLKTPVELMDKSLVEQYYKDGSALFSVTVAEGAEVDAIGALYDTLGDSGAITGNAANTAWMQKQIVTEVLSAVAIVLPLIIIILMITTTSWIAPLLFLATIAVAVLINMGTNIFFGEVSFITQSVSPILQLAVSMDYAIFLLGSFERFRSETDDVVEAMRSAIKQAFASIAASAVTTVFGFLALMFMDFGIGSDLGMNLVKGVILSYISVMVFLPALALASVKWLDKTSHKRIFPELRGIGKGLVKIRIPALILVLVLVIPCYLGQSRTDFLYGNGDPDPNTRFGADSELIAERFGEETVLVLLVPRGDPGSESELSAEIERLPHISSVMSYSSAVGVIPEGFLSEEIISQFYSENWARIIVYTDTGFEGEEAFAAVSSVREVASSYYDESYTCGQSANLYDVKQVVTGDSTKVNLIAIVFIFLTLLVTFRSLTLPLALLFVIETAIWINLSIPYFTGVPLVYLGYLVINTVQLGATIDYAILMTDGYVENRKTMDARTAVEETLRVNFVSVITSGFILSGAGFALGLTSSMEVVAMLGNLLARGTLLSMAMVLLALPATLMITDPLTTRLTWKSGFLKPEKKEAKVK